MNPDLLCSVCSNTPLSSTERDVVITYIDQGVHRILESVKSLRSVNPLCSIVIFHPFNAYIPNQVRQTLESYGASLISTEPRYSIPHMDRYIAYYAYLTVNKSRFDRVLHIDAFDVHFQGDPFSEFVKPGMLSLALEGLTIEVCGINSDWIEQAYGLNGYFEVSKNPVICSGTIGSDTTLFLSFLDDLFNKTRFLDVRKESIDQGHVNYLIWSNRLTNGLKQVDLNDCNSSVLTVQTCCFNNSCPSIDSFLNIRSFGVKPPAIVHQYNRYAQMVDHVNKICPTDDFDRYYSENPSDM